MKELPSDIQMIISSFRRDAAHLLEIQINILNSKVREITTMKRFRPLTVKSVVNRALRIWYETKGQPFMFYHTLSGLYIQWLINSGVTWSLDIKIRSVQNIILSLLDWFKSSQNDN